VILHRNAGSMGFYDNDQSGFDVIYLHVQGRCMNCKSLW